MDTSLASTMDESTLFLLIFLLSCLVLLLGPIGVSFFVDLFIWFTWEKVRVVLLAHSSFVLSFSHFFTFHFIILSCLVSLIILYLYLCNPFQFNSIQSNR